MSARKNSTRNRRPNRRRTLTFETLESRQLLAVTTFNPVADSYVGRGVGGAGSANVLDVEDFGNGGGDRWAYVRFDLTGFNIEDLNGATLSFYKQDGSRTDTIVAPRFEVYGLNNFGGNTPQDWSEATLDSGSVGDEYSGTADVIDLGRLYNLDADNGANVFESINDPNGEGLGLPQSLSGPDLVTFLESRIADDGLVTFITLVDSGSDDRGWGYGSRENTASLQPKLELDFEGEEVPDPYPENPVRYTRQVEYLNRGIVAIRQTSQIYVGWRMLGTDPADVAFNLYRSANGGAAVKLNGSPLTATTDYVDNTANLMLSNEYFVRPVIGGIEQDPSESYLVPAFATAQQFLSVPLNRPAGGMTPSGQNYTYNANDASVGDLDGDGDYEIVLKWDPSNSQDVSIAGYTGNTIFDAYTIEGFHLWRIDLGINVRSGAHYTPFIVYDLDGDGKAEVAMKTGPGTVDGLGQDVILPGDDPDADYRNADGRITTGPEYLTIFNGETGAAMETIPFEPARNNVTSWGDDWGNRSERHNATVAYLDGVRPSLVFTRGYNGPASGFSMARTDVVAYNWRDDTLTELWHFKARLGQEGNINVQYIAQGNHNISVGDVDGDGFDEIVYGASVIDHDGTGLHSTGLGHGDTTHFTDMDLSNPGLEIFTPHEGTGSNGHIGASLRDAMTGEVTFAPTVVFDTEENEWPDVGRGAAFDIDPNHPGYEMWDSYHPSIYNAQGVAIYNKPGNMHINFGVWWDADLLRETLDGTTVSDWNYTTAGRVNFDLNPGAGTTPPNVSSNNSTKATPSLSADLFGDWREEIIWRRSDNTALNIYTTTIPSTSRIYTLMHDTQYREAIAWQNSAYNQPPHPSFFLGAGMTTPPQPDIYIAFPDPIPGDFDLDRDVDGDDLAIWEQTYGTSPGAGFFGDANNDGEADGRDFLIWQRNYGTAPLAAAQTAATVGALTPTPAAEPLDGALASLVSAGLPRAGATSLLRATVAEEPPDFTADETETTATPKLSASSTSSVDNTLADSESSADDEAQEEILSAAFAGWDSLDRYAL